MSLFVSDSDRDWFQIKFDSYLKNRIIGIRLKNGDQIYSSRIVEFSPDFGWVLGVIDNDTSVERPFVLRSSVIDGIFYDLQRFGEGSIG